MAPELKDRRNVLVTFDPSAAVLSAILNAHPEAHGGLAEAPGEHHRLHDVLVREELVDRTQLLATDPLRGPFQNNGYDAAVVVHAMHLQSPKHNKELLVNIAQAVLSGAPILLVDHWLDATRTRPGYAAVSAAELFLATGEGRNYAVDEVISWLNQAGLVMEAHRPLVGPASLIVARRPM